MVGWVWKLLNLFVSSSSKWWQILQFCLRCSFGLRAWKRGEEIKKLSHFFWISSEMMKCCLQFFPTNVALTHMEIFHTLYLLMNLSLAIKPNYMSLDFLSNSRAWWRCLQNSFQQSLIQIWKYFSLKPIPQESFYNAKIVVIFYFSLGFN